jgi:hypothetical protein
VRCFEARNREVGAAEKNRPHRLSLRGVGRGSFAHRAVQQSPAQHAEVIDHELAIEVIGFVLNRDRQQAFGFELEWLAVLVERLDRDSLGAVDVFTNTGKREAAFVEGRLAATSMMNRRFETPICGAANPTPGAAYIVSAMSSIKRRNSASNSSTGLPGSRRRLSG